MSKHTKIRAACLIVILSGGSSLRRPSFALAQSPTLTISHLEPKASKLKGQFINIGDIRLHYVTTGSGKPVVLIHGNAGYLQDFEFGTLDLLAPSYRVLAFDLPGHGLSGMPKKAEGTIEEQASILHRVLNELGIKRPILVGHSWGGAIALTYALHYPGDLSGLVLLAPAAYPDHHRDTPFGRLLHIPLLSDLCLALIKPIIGRRILKRSLQRAFYPDKVPYEYLKAAAVWLGRKQIKAFIQNDEVLDLSLSRQNALYENIRGPVIIVTGDADVMVSPQQNALPLHRAVRRSELIVVPYTGHQLPVTHPEVVLQAIEMVLSDSSLSSAK